MASAGRFWPWGPLDIRQTTAVGYFLANRALSTRPAPPPLLTLRST
jgi:hypothetical protein